MRRRCAEQAGAGEGTRAERCRRPAWRRVAGGEGTNADPPQSSRFAAVRVRPAHRDYWRSHTAAEEWLLVEWPQGDNQPTKYWRFRPCPHGTHPSRADRRNRPAMRRWRIERDYQELKREIGLDHYEGRGWRGFHHHTARCDRPAYGFLSLRKARPDSPLRGSSDVPQGASPTQRLSTPRLRRSDPNATSPSRSPASELGWPAPWLDDC